MSKLLKALTVMTILSTCFLLYGEPENSRKSDLEQIFARGVYWPWECNKPSAKAAGKEYWQFIDDFMKDLKEKWNCNVIWITNGPNPEELPRVCELADKHNIRILATASRFGNYYYGGVPLNEASLKKDAEAMAAQVKDYKMFGAYVLKDEPLKSEAVRLEYIRGIMEKVDPAKPSIVVSMIGDGESYIKKTGFPIVCIDPYMFGYKGDPNAPNPSCNSRNSFRSLASGFAEMSREHGKTSWIMPQAFQEIWGPMWYDEKHNIVAEPGAYLHWRFPQESELRWQIWESVRTGNKGVLFFDVLTQLAQTYDPATGTPTKQAQDAIKTAGKNKWPVLKKRLETNTPSSLTYQDGSPVPQAYAVINTYAKLKEIEPLLCAFKISEVPYAAASKPLALKSFTTNGSIYCVVVNDDCDKAGEFKINFLPDVQKVVDIISGKEVTLSPDENTRTSNGKIKLEAGDGTVLKLEILENASAILLFSEDFSCAKNTLSLENASIVQDTRAFGMGTYCSVRKNAGKDSKNEKSFIILKGLMTGKDRMTGNVMNLVNSGKGMAFLKIDGSCPNTEDLVVQFVDDKGEGWNKTSSYEYPIEIPKGTKEIKIFLNRLNASVAKVSIFCIPVTEKN